VELSPLMMPLSERVYAFSALPRNTFRGLPGLLADSLPD
jgi:serine/threonine-protein kinase HipA